MRIVVCIRYVTIFAPLTFLLVGRNSTECRQEEDKSRLRMGTTILLRGVLLSYNLLEMRDIL